MFPEKFCENIAELLPEESAMFLDALQLEPRCSIRYNPFKGGDLLIDGNPVPWCKYGRVLPQRPSFTLDPLFHAGVYYPQESSSMFVEHLLTKATCNLTNGLTVLDLCAAPGGKTTLLSSLVGEEGVVVANEVIRQRAATLCDNVRKWGVGNVVVTNNDPQQFAQLKGVFNVMLIDAPCSGEGMFRKDPKAREEWSENSVELCAARQKRIMSDSWDALNEDGIFIYSTCTFNTKENEDNIGWVCDNFDVEPIEIEIDPSWGIVKGDVKGINTFRFYPHKVTGEGLFVAVMRKKSSSGKPKVKPNKSLFSQLNNNELSAVKKWIKEPETTSFAKISDNIFCYHKKGYQRVKMISENTCALHSGILMGQLFNNKLKPDHSLAMFYAINRDNISVTELSLEQSLDYLRKKEIDPTLLKEGINLICYNTKALGWIKRIAGRANNNYPNSLRIVNL